MASKNAPDPAICDKAIRLKIDKRPGESIQRSNILQSLKSLNHGLIAHVDAITTTGKNVWFISFLNDFNFKHLIGKKILINEREILIEDAETPRIINKVFTFKLIGLKPNFDKQEISKFFMQQGINPSEIVNVYDEYCREPEFSHIKNGIIRVKLSFDAVTNTKYKDIVNKLAQNTYIQNQPVSIQRVDKPRCLFCQSLEHKIANCPVKNLKCTKCGKNGHEDSNCNLAKRTAVQNTDHLFDDADIDELDSSAVATTTRKMFNRQKPNAHANDQNLHQQNLYGTTADSKKSNQKTSSTPKMDWYFFKNPNPIEPNGLNPLQDTMQTSNLDSSNLSTTSKNDLKPNRSVKTKRKQGENSNSNNPSGTKKQSKKTKKNKEDTSVSNLDFQLDESTVEAAASNLLNLSVTKFYQTQL